MSNRERPVVVRMITWLPVGGIERRLVAVLPRLKSDYGWDPKVICFREEGPLAEELKDHGIEVRVVPFPSRLSPPAIMQVARLLKNWSADVAHSHMYRANIPGMIAAKLAGTPVRFAQIHNVDSWDNGRQRLTERLLVGLRTGTFSVSSSVQRDVMKTLHINESQAPILYNGVDIEKFYPSDELARKARQQWQVTENTIVFVVSARLHPQKNPEGVLDAVNKVRTQRPESEFRLLFFGDGKLKGEMADRIAHEHLSQWVRLMGKSDSMEEVLNGADAMVLSSFKEGFSNAIVESLACGTPVIASRVGGNAEAINEESVGWIHESGNSDALAKQMIEALDRKRSGLGKMSDSCRQRAEFFSLAEMVRRTDRFYQKAMKKVTR